MSGNLDSLDPLVRIQHLEDKLLEFAFINQELMGALSGVVGDVERSGAVDRQQGFRNAAVHIDMRLRDVVRAFLGEEAGRTSHLNFGERE